MSENKTDPILQLFDWASEATWEDMDQMPELPKNEGEVWFTPGLVAALMLAIKAGMGAGNYDREVAHVKMDIVLCAVLNELGYEDAVRIFKHTPKWYA